MSMTQDAALDYVRRGWAPIPIPYRSKNPGRNGWEKERHTEADVLHLFNGKPSNIGVLLGEPSGGLVDIDLDHETTLRLVSQFLPATGAVFGRESKPRSHWLYRVTGEPKESRRYKSKSAGTLVEYRSTGCQTVFPPSTHECGEAILWDEAGEPAVIEAWKLFAAVKRLADAALKELGEAAKHSSRPIASPGGRHVDNCLAAMLKMNMSDHNDGSSRLYAAACRAVEHDLSDADAVSTIHAYAQLKPFPRAWSDDDILSRIRHAEQKTQRGKALRRRTRRSKDAPIDGDPDADSDGEELKLRASELDPATTAAEALESTNVDGVSRLRFWRGSFWKWSAGAYREVPTSEIRAMVVRFLNDRCTKLTSSITSDHMDQVKALSCLGSRNEPPCWIDQPTACDIWNPTEVLVTRRELLHLPAIAEGRDDCRAPATPRFFSTSALDLDFDPEAPVPTAWCDFLGALWPDDPQSIEALQMWFGYCLTGDTRQQKMLMLVGPKRSGKGTIARIQRALVGAENCAGPTLASLGTNFGLWPLLGKSLAVISDARLSGRTDSAIVVERLLSISGEDALTVDRKNLEPVTAKLPTRIAILSNELPRLSDASGALVSRLIVLRLTRSWYGVEDHALTDKLMEELPGILNWAIAGWKMLRDRGRLLQPASAGELVGEMEDLASPISAFVRDCCAIGPEHRAAVDDLFGEWKDWCDANGRREPGTVQTFARDLLAAVPTLRRCRPRDGETRSRAYDGIGIVLRR